MMILGGFTVPTKYPKNKILNQFQEKTPQISSREIDVVSSSKRSTATCCCCILDYQYAMPWFARHIWMIWFPNTWNLANISSILEIPWLGFFPVIKTLRHSILVGWWESSSISHYNPYPLASMYGVFTYISHTNSSNVGKKYHTWMVWVYNCFVESAIQPNHQVHHLPWTQFKL